MNSDVPLNVHPFHSERENMILQWAFKFKGWQKNLAFERMC
jgi:hypothetical protein